MEQTYYEPTVRPATLEEEITERDLQLAEVRAENERLATENAWLRECLSTVHASFGRAPVSGTGTVNLEVSIELIKKLRQIFGS